MDFLCLCCWCLVFADIAEGAVEVGIHHAIDVPMEVCQDDILGVLLHLHGHSTVDSVLHVSALTKVRDKSGSLEEA